jgi:hypothetical protein
VGYDLHITRKANLSDEDGLSIGEAEWRHVIENDPDLSLDQETECTMTNGAYVFAAWKGQAGLLGWYNGEVSATYPDAPLIQKMVQIAESLGAIVQGDDGEVYREDGSSSHLEPNMLAPRAPGLLVRLAQWFRHRRVARDLQRTAPSFRVGQRVSNPWGVVGIVIAVDRIAMDGLGSVTVRQADGHEVHLSHVASGLQIISDGAGGS